MTLTEVLPAQKTSPSNAVHYSPSESVRGGLLVIDTARTRTEYLLAEFDAEDGRGFRLAKVTAGTDAEAESYDVYCTPAGVPVECECKGFIYSRDRRCKHTMSIEAVIANGWL